MVSHSDTQSAIGVFTSQFKSKELEHDYRQCLLKEDKKQGLLIISASVAFIFLISWIDYRSYGFSDYFLRISLARIVILIVSTVIACSSVVTKKEIWFDLMMLGFSLAVVVTNIYIAGLKQAKPVTMASTEILIIWAFYLAIPSALMFRMIPLLILSLFSTSMESTPILWVHHFISHSVGLGCAVIMNRSKRQKFLVFLREIELNEKLQKSENEIRFISERLAEQNKLWKDHALKDPLTGLLNRRAFMEYAEEQWSRAVRKNEDCAVILFDIDHFKTINDSYGHPTGDLVLSELTALITRLNRAYDKLGRWGGEEFIMFVPEADSGHAEMIGERIRKAVESHAISALDGTELKITISVGVSSKSLSRTLSLEELINHADKALYMAKMSGRNRVCVYSETEELTE